MSASLKDRLEVDQPSGSGQKYYSNHRGRGTYSKYSRGHPNGFKNRPFRPAVKEEPAEPTVSLLSRIEPSSDSLLLRLSPERKRVELSEEEDVKGKVVDLQSGRSSLAEMPGQVAETATAPRAYMRPNTQHDLVVDSPEPTLSMSASDAATDKLAEELIASALEQGRRLFANSTQSVDVPMSDAPRSPASEAAVDDMLGVEVESNSSPLPGNTLVPHDPKSPASEAKPLSSPVSPSSVIVEQAKSILLPLIMQNVRARDPTADIEKIKERALSLLTDTECAELMQLASQVRIQQRGMQTIAQGGEKAGVAQEVRGESQSGSRCPMDLGSDPPNGESRKDSTRDNRSPTERDAFRLLSAYPGSPGASTSVQYPKRQKIDRSRYAQRSPSTSTIRKCPPKAPRAMLEASSSHASCMGTTRISPPTQGNSFRSGPSNLKSGSSVSRTPPDSALTGSVDKTKRMAPQRTPTPSFLLTTMQMASPSASSSPSKPVSTSIPTSEADVAMELASDEDGDVPQSSEPGVQGAPSCETAARSSANGSNARAGETSATSGSLPEAAAAQLGANGGKESGQRGDPSSISSTPPQTQTGHDKPPQSDEETDVGSSPAQPAPQSSTTAVLPELALGASAQNHSSEAGTTVETLTEAAASGGQDRMNAPALIQTPTEPATATVENVHPEDTAAEDIPPGLSSGDSCKRKLTPTSSPPQKRRALSRDFDSGPSGDKALPDEQAMLVEESGEKEEKESETSNLGTQEELRTEEPMDQESGNTSKTSVTDSEIVVEVSEPQNIESKATPPAEGAEKQPKEDTQGAAMDVDKPEGETAVLREKIEQSTEPSAPVTDNREHSPIMPADPQAISPMEPNAKASVPSPILPAPQPTVPMPKLYFAQVGASSINTHNLTFTVDEETAAAARRWAEREMRYDPSQLHVRFSLQCLPCAAVQAVSDRLDSSATPLDFTNALWGVTTQWPRCGFLLVIVNPDDQAYRGVLLPEDIDPIDGVGPVDVSARIKPGENVVQLLMLSNQSDYLYVLHAGVPPQEELDAQLDVYRWNRFAGKQ